MKVLNSLLERHIVVFLAASLVVPLGVAETTPGPRTPTAQTASTSAAQTATTSVPAADAVPQTPSPDSPGSTPAQAPAQPAENSPPTNQSKQTGYLRPSPCRHSSRTVSEAGGSFCI